LHRFRSIGRSSVKGDARLWRERVNKVYDFLEQEQPRRGFSQSGSDYDAIKALQPEHPFHRRFGGFTEIDQTTFGVVPQSTQMLDLRIDVVANEFGSEVRKCAEIGEGWLDANCEDSSFCHGAGSYSCCSEEAL
jgi:hypothetical protein